MSIIVTFTADNTCSYPQHSHKMTEITCYTEGQGVMRTDRGDITFAKGTIIIIPPEVKHGSVSDKPYKNICVHTDELDIDIDEIMQGNDNSFGDVSNMAWLMLRLSMNAKENNAIMKSVLDSYFRLVSSLLNVHNTKDRLSEFKDELMANLSNPYFSLCEAEQNSGYAVDYFRALFKKKYTTTPCAYLTRMRMQYAKNLLDVYGNKMKINQLAYNCGYQDALYFSKIFKETYGVSPKLYVEKSKRQ